MRLTSLVLLCAECFSLPRALVSIVIFSFMAVKCVCIMMSLFHAVARL